MANHAVPVESCTGWTNPCPFCDKRFCTWIPIEGDDTVSTVPTTPGAFMFAFDTKRSKEVVAIGIHKTNVQTAVITKLKDLRRQISQKKLKETKSSVSLRYVTWEDVTSRDACVVYAHWQNCGVLPRLSTQWPGVEILNKGQDFEYLEESQKWCFPLKDPTWRKKKTNTGPQAVPKCKGRTGNCSFCDSKFSAWVPLEVSRGRRKVEVNAPNLPGFCMYALNKQGKRQVVNISTNESVNNDFSFSGLWLEQQVKGDNKELGGSECIAEGRWMTVSDLKDTDSCLMYAHFLNSGKDLPTDRTDQGRDILEASENFFMRQQDRQWCYDENKSGFQKPVNKAKERRNLLQSMLEELHTDE